VIPETRGQREKTSRVPGQRPADARACRTQPGRFLCDFVENGGLVAAALIRGAR